MQTDLVGATVRMKAHVNALGTVRAVAFSGHPSYFAIIVEDERGEFFCLDYRDIVAVREGQS